MQPAREAFRLGEGRGRNNLRYYPFYGRGHVQPTREADYERTGA